MTSMVLRVMSKCSCSHQKAQIGPDVGKIREDTQEVETRGREGGHSSAANQRQIWTDPPDHGEARCEPRVHTSSLCLVSCWQVTAFIRTLLFWFLVVQKADEEEEQEDANDEDEAEQGEREAFI